MLWYMAMLLDGVYMTFEVLMEANIAKLSARYTEKFSTQDSVRRVDEKNV